MSQTPNGPGGPPSSSSRRTDEPTLQVSHNQGLPSIDLPASPSRDAATAPELNGTFLAGYDDPATSPRPRRRVRRPAPAKPKPRPTRPTTLPLPFAPMLQSCLAPEPEPEHADLELILGESNLLPFAFLREGDRVGRAVVKIAREDGAAGTGFLVAPGILLTNHHVLPDPEIAADARALANFEAEPPDDPHGRFLTVALRPEELFVTHPELDFTFCGVAGLDHLGIIQPHRTSLGILRRDFVNIIQHPRGRPKEVALQDNQVVKVDHVVIQYSCDTEPGSSGSPVLDNRWRLVALHHASVVADEHRGGRRSQGADPRLHYLNEGIRLSAIALWLETAEAETPALRDQTARLRAVFAGLDPQAGFFGALGRRAGRRQNTAQLVVDFYRRDGATLDLGAWDLTDAGRPVRDRLDDLGRALAEMRLDLWCLLGVGPDDARRLAEHLDTHHRLDYHVADARHPRPGAAPVAVLHRRGAPAFEPTADLGLTAQLRPGDGHTLGFHLLDGRAPWPEAASPASGDTLLIAPGRPVSPDDLDTLRRAGHAPRLTASGPDGGLVLLSGRRSRVERLFVSPNLASLRDPALDLIVTDDRGFPDSTPPLSPRSPLALRVIFGKPPRRRPARSEPGARERPAPNEPKPQRKSSPRKELPREPRAPQSKRSPRASPA